MSSPNGQNPSSTSIIAPKPQLAEVYNKSSKNSNTKKKKINKSSNNHISSKNKPLKVVYISNPKKFQVNADEFQALVQGLTGRDATEWTDDLAQGVGPTRSGVHHDEIQQEALMDDDDDQVQVEGYDGASEMSVDYYGPLNNNGHVICGDEEKGQMIYYGGFPSFYD